MKISRLSDSERLNKSRKKKDAKVIKQLEARIDELDKQLESLMVTKEAIKAEGIKEARDKLLHIGSNEYHWFSRYADKLEKGE